MAIKRNDWITIGILGAGAIALWIWYRSRTGASLLPSTNYAQGAGPTAQGFGGTRPDINDPNIVAARGAYTGPGSRFQCAGRWIKTVDGPAYGVCATDADFGLWTSRATSDQQRYATTQLVAQILDR